MCASRAASSHASAVYSSVGPPAQNGGAFMMRRRALTPLSSVSMSAASARNCGSMRGTQHADMQTVAGAKVHPAGMILDHANDEMQLDVRPVQRRIGLNEAAGPGEIGRQQAGAVPTPPHDLARQSRQTRRVEGEQV